MGKENPNSKDNIPMKVKERRFRIKIKVGDKYLLHDPAYRTKDKIKLGALEDAWVIHPIYGYRVKHNLIDAGFSEYYMGIQTFHVEVDA